MSNKRKKDKSRALVITDLGERILREVAAGTYRHRPPGGTPNPAGSRMHKGKRRAKFRGNHGKT